MRNIAIVAWGDAKSIADGLVGLAKVRMLEYAENQEMGVVELLVSFKDQVYTNQVYDRMEALGACSVTLVTFSKTDWIQEAAGALYRIRGLCAPWTRGAPFEELDPKILDKVKELVERDLAAKRAEDSQFDNKTAVAMKASLESLSARVADKDDVRGLKKDLEKTLGLEQTVKKQQETMDSLEQLLEREQGRTHRSSMQIAKMNKNIAANAQVSKSMQLMYDEACRRAEKAEAEVKKLKDGGAVIEKVKAVAKLVHAQGVELAAKMDAQSKELAAKMDAQSKAADAKNELLERKMDLMTAALQLLESGLRKKDEEEEDATAPEVEEPPRKRPRAAAVEEDSDEPSEPESEGY